MKTTNRFKRKPLARLIALSLVTASVAGAVHAAAPLAGTEIKNLATVSYEDENGNTYTAQSNEAVITVAPQYRATLENDRTQSGAPGQTVYFPHTITNTGNTPDTYALSATGGSVIYEDKNGNGQPDAGEAAITSITIDPGKTANVVVAYAIPSSASPGTDTTVTFTAESGNANGIVDDIGDNADAVTDPSGEDADRSATNTDIVNITSGPVLVLNKEAVFNAAESKVTYTLTVKNTGGSDAKLVDIIDAVPLVDTDGSGANMLPLTNVQIVSVNGLLTSNSDTVPAIGAAVLEQVSEVDLDTDLDGDGLKNNAAVNVIKATDAVLPTDTTVSIVYSAEYNPDWAAGALIENTFVTHSDNDETAGRETTTTSNTTTNVIPQSYGVDAQDDKVDPAESSPGVNDGHDDDDGNGNGPADDLQYVDTIASGDVVLFRHTITNEGNGDDIFNLKVTNATTDGFPDKTVFTLWDSTGAVQLTDSDSDGVPDTGVLGQDGSTTVMVKADLPAGASGEPANGYNAVLTATSSGDDTKSNPTNLQLGKITAPAVDLAAVTTDPAFAVSANNAVQGYDGFNGLKEDGVTFSNANAHDEGPVMFANTPVGGVATFPMAVANESGSSDSFLLGHDYLPKGWTVVFKDDSGNTITSTPFLPPGGTFNYTAHVTVSNDPTEALGDTTTLARAADANGYDANDNGDQDANGIGAALTSADSDLDYVIKFTVSSSADSSRNDFVLHGIDVDDLASVAVTPDGQNQVQPGGTVDYPHKLTNNGNIAETLEITRSNSDGDWNSTTLIEKIVPTGIELVDINTLKDGDKVRIYSADGIEGEITVTDTDGDAALASGSVEFKLNPGEYLNITNKVFAPGDASQGEVNATKLNAKDPASTTPRSTATDTSRVILGQVRLDKTVALQTDCTNTGTIGAFATIQTAQVEPGQCAVWQIVAKNEGDAQVKNVVIKDSVPAYTAYLANSLQYCKGLSCTPASVTDAVATGGAVGSATNDAGEISGDAITFFVGDSPDPLNKLGGQLLPGESATVRFTVKVDE